jgi:DNA-binding response OmpR family regulator
LQSDAAQLVHCPRCLGTDVDLSRPRAAGDSVLLPAPLRCRICTTQFYKRVSPTKLHRRSAPGRSHSSVPGVLPIAGPRAPGVLVVDDLIPFSKLIRETFVGRGFAVFGAKTADEGLELFRAYQPQIDLGVIGLILPVAGNLDLAAELERLQPGLPLLYLVGAGKSIVRCSIEAQSPGAVLTVPFTEGQLIACVGGLLDVEAAARMGRGEQLWDRLIAGSDWIPSGTAMLYVYELRQAALAEGHAATLSGGNVPYTFRATNCDEAPYSMTVRAQDVTHARWLIGQASGGRKLVVAA